MVSENLAVTAEGDVKDVETGETVTDPVREMRRASNDYIDDLMKRTDDALAANLAELRKTRNNIKASQRNNQQ